MKLDKQVIRQTTIESILTTASEQGADLIKEEGGGIITELLTDTAALRFQV